MFSNQSVRSANNAKKKCFVDVQIEEVTGNQESKSVPALLHKAINEAPSTTIFANKRNGNLMDWTYDEYLQVSTYYLL